MKKLNLTVLLLLLVSAKTFSQLADENFDYQAGDSVQQHGWTTIGSVFTNKILVTSPGLIFPEYVNSGFGNAVTVDTTGQDVYKDFSSARTSGNIFTSFLVKVKSAKSAGDYFTALLSSTNSNSFAGRVYARDSSGKIAFGLSKTTETVSYTPAVYLRDSTYLLILKYSINQGTANDSVSLFIYSSSMTIPSFEPLPVLGPKGSSGADLSDAGRISLRQGSASAAPRIVMDGIFITTSWDNSALPVELASFSSFTENGNVHLLWNTFSELNNLGFDIERLFVNYQSPISDQWKKSGFVQGSGTSLNSANYKFSDNDLNPGIYKYRLKQKDFNGNFEYFYLNNEVNVLPPAKFSLSQNFPNPFNPKTVISYKLATGSFIKVDVFDILGNKVKNLVNADQIAGSYSVEFDGSDLASGNYFYKLQSEKFTEIKRMTLIK